MFFTSGERCEDRGRTYQDSCANQCPRSCTDLWEHVQCLQGACHPGCSFRVHFISVSRPQLIKPALFLCFSHCFFLSQVVAVLRASCCRMVFVFHCQTVAAVSHQATAPWSSFPKRNSQLTAIPGRNGLVLIDAIWLTLKGLHSLLSPFLSPLPDSSVCENGTLVCTKLACPVYDHWSSWSSCSVSCGRGQRTRTRLCRDSEGGPSCSDTQESENCDMPACPGLTKNQNQIFMVKKPTE